MPHGPLVEGMLSWTEAAAGYALGVVAQGSAFIQVIFQFGSDNLGDRILE